MGKIFHLEEGLNMNVHNYTHHYNHIAMCLTFTF